MDKKKLTRRVALGSIAGGLAGTAAVLQALKGRYAVKMPEGAATGTVTVGGKSVVDYHGMKITVEVPRMVIKTPEDRQKLNMIVAEQIKNSPMYAEANKMEFEKWKERVRRARMAELAEKEKEDLKKIEDSAAGKDEKDALTKQVKKDYQAAGTLSEKMIAESKMPAL